MAVNTESGNIVFSYSNKDIFDDVSLLSAYMAKSWAGTDKSVDEFSITDDEKELFDICVNQALPSIHEAMIKLTTDIDSAFDRNTNIIFSLNNNEEYNKNTLSIIDSTLRDCIKFGTLAEFYSFCLNPELQKVAMDRFNANIFLLKQRLFQLKKKPISSLLG